MTPTGKSLEKTSKSKFKTTQRSSHRMYSIKKGVLKNVAKFTGNLYGLWGKHYSHQKTISDIKKLLSCENIIFVVPILKIPCWRVKSGRKRRDTSKSKQLPKSVGLPYTFTVKERKLLIWLRKSKWGINSWFQSAAPPCESESEV